MSRDEGAPLAGVKACVFDAYGTLFDPSTVAEVARARLGADLTAAMGATWRQKQLEYTWLRGLMGRYTSFWQVTREALEYALEAHGLDPADEALITALMEGYLAIGAYPEARATLQRIQAAGLHTAVLSNGSPQMLQAALSNADLTDRLSAVWSVESVGQFKPHPSVYQWAVDETGLPPDAICFLSSNAWDAAGAAAFGLVVVHVNRFGQPVERLPGRPSHQIQDLAGLPGLLGVGMSSG